MPESRYAEGLQGKIPVQPQAVSWSLRILLNKALPRRGGGGVREEEEVGVIRIRSRRRLPMGSGVFGRPARPAKWRAAPSAPSARKPDFVKLPLFVNDKIPQMGTVKENKLPLERQARGSFVAMASEFRLDTFLRLETSVARCGGA